MQLEIHNNMVNRLKIHCNKGRMFLGLELKDKCIHPINQINHPYRKVNRIHILKSKAHIQG